MKNGLALMICLSLFSVPVHASSGGAWGSSGGDLFNDLQNPWWFFNTKKVTYCISLDPQTVSVSKKKVSELVKAAITYWKAEFNRKLDFPVTPDQRKFNEKRNSVGIATQDFEEKPCTGAEDLKIQLGSGTLSPDQHAYLSSLAHHLAVAVRTQYDEVNLRGKGFIWLAPDLGKDAVAQYGDKIEKAWSNDLILYAVLLHEFGHVFGLGHMGDASIDDSYSIMAENFPEYILKYGDPSLPISIVPNFLSPSDSFFVATEAAPSYFDQQDPCLFLGLMKLRPGVYKLFCAAMGDTKEVDLGRVSFSNYFITTDLIERAALPAGQKVFDWTDELSFELGGISIAKIQTVGAVYTTPKGTQKSIYLELSPRTVRGLGIVDNKIEEVFVGYAGPLTGPSFNSLGTVRHLPLHQR